MTGNFEIVSRLLIAALPGSVTGFERERLGWAAAVRTHMLVCVGCRAHDAGVGNWLCRCAGQEERRTCSTVSGSSFPGAGSIRPPRLVSCRTCGTYGARRPSRSCPPRSLRPTCQPQPGRPKEADQPLGEQ
ncbi:MULTISPECIES: MgtC/SapB family protein [Paraburkholderia]|uniref:MgtC/SapB family protein n=1 Tax=Paraburkholderia TaxID=1822464 RepID=UPI0034D29236